jgi:invasin B
MTTGLTRDLAAIDRASYANNKAMADMASSLASVTDGFVTDAKKAAQALFASGVPVDGESAATMPGADLNKPLLSLPKAPLTKSMNSAANLTLLLGMFKELLTESGQMELDSRIAMFKEIANARRLSLEMNAMEFGEAVGVAESAVEQFKAAKEQAAAAKTKLAGAQEEATAAEAELASLENDDPARPQVLLKFEAAHKALLAATQKSLGAVENEKRLSADVLQKIRIATDIETRAKTGAIASPLRESEMPKLSSSAARLSLLMATLTLMMGDGAEANMKADQEIFKEMQTQRQKALEKSATEYDTEVQKAEQVSKTMGCIGKVIGGLIMAASILAIPFTGGASLALAVIGVGLMTADAITSVVTGNSLTGMALSPVMKALQPLIEAVSKLIVNALESAGVPPEKAQSIGGIIAAVVVALATIAMMIAVAFVAKGPAGAKAMQLLSKSMSGILTKVTQSATLQAIKAFVRPLTNAVSKQTARISLDQAAINKARLLLNVTESSLKLWGAGVKGYRDIAVGVYAKNATQSHGQLELSSFTLQQLERYLTDIAETFATVFKMNQQLTTIASNAMQGQTEAGRAILRNTHA